MGGCRGNHQALGGDVKELEAELRNKKVGELLVGPYMRDLTSFRIGGKVPLLIRPFTEETFFEVMGLLKEGGYKWRVLGGGTNLLVSDEDLDVVLLDLRKAFCHIHREGNLVRVGAGVRMAELIRYCSREGLGGLEALSGIPGSIGGAVKGNAGSWGKEICQFIKSMRVLDGNLKKLEKKQGQFEFSYRRGPLKEGEILLEVILELEEKDPVEIRRQVRRFWGERKKRQPVGVPSAGCIFKNPEGGPSAGFLIERVGLKGKRIGGAMISDLHANFILNLGGATFKDVLALIELAQQKVRDAFGYKLELEVELWS